MALMRSRYARVAIALAGLYVLLLFDLRGGARRDLPRVVRAFQAAGPLRAGAAVVDLQPPLPVVRAGYGLPRAIADRERDALKVRALVLEAGGKRLALVLVDLVLVPEDLARALEGRLADRSFTGSSSSPRTRTARSAGSMPDSSRRWSEPDATDPTSWPRS